MPKVQTKAFVARLEDVCQSFWSVRNTLHKGPDSYRPRLIPQKEPDYRMYLLEVFTYGISFLLGSKL